jgi:hypothetical protein
MIDLHILETVLKGIEKDGPVTARVICEKWLNVPYGNDLGGPTVREAVQALRLTGHFIAASASGYWIESEPKEQRKYIKALRGRLHSIQTTLQALERLSSEQQELLSFEDEEGRDE